MGIIPGILSGLVLKKRTTEGTEKKKREHRGKRVA
jgi:hypothetical protein